MAVQVKRYRCMLRLSQEFMASQLDVDRTTYCKMEKNGKFNSRQLPKLANLFRCTVGKLFELDKVEYQKQVESLSFKVS